VKAPGAERGVGLPVAPGPGILGHPVEGVEQGAENRHRK